MVRSRNRRVKSTGESLAQAEARVEAEAAPQPSKADLIAQLEAQIAALKRPVVPSLESVLATKLPIVVNGVGILVDPRQFSKGSYGFSLSNRSVDMTIGGVKGTLTVGVCAVFKGSKPKQ